MDGLDYVSPAGESLEQIAERFAAGGFRGALVGPHGRGKSTLMRALSALPLPGDGHDPDRRWIQAQADGSHRAGLHALLRRRGGVLMVDGYDLLGWRDRLAVRRQPRVLVTSHRPTRLPTLLRCETSPALLARLVGRLSAESLEQLGDAGVDRLFSDHGGNVRDALRALYDRVADGELVTDLSST